MEEPKPLVNLVECIHASSRRHPQEQQPAGIPKSGYLSWTEISTSIGFKTLKDLQHCSYNELFVVELYVKHNQRGTFYGTT